MLKTFKSGRTTANLKEDRSLVTEADLFADRLITEKITAYDPEGSILSEELNPSLEREIHVAWVVDPLDGTTNFSLGLSIWGVSIAQIEDGLPIAAVVYFPVLQETYTARLGQGAWLNGDRLDARPRDPGLPGAFFSCCSRTFRQYEVDIRYKTRILGSACYSFCAVARGLALIGFEATPKIWDIAAGCLIVREAGGAIEPFDGSQPFPLRAGCDYRRTNFPTLAAGTPELLAHARGGIRLKS